MCLNNLQEALSDSSRPVPLQDSFCFWGEASLGSTAAVNTPDIPSLQALLWPKLLVPAFSSSHPHVPDHPSYPRTLALALPLAWTSFPCPDSSHSHSLSVFKSQLKGYRSSFPDSPSPQTTSCPPKLHTVPQTFHGLWDIYIYIYMYGYMCVMADLTSWIPSSLPTVKWPPLFQCWFQCLTHYGLLTNRGVDWRNEWINR